MENVLICVHAKKGKDTKEFSNLLLASTVGDLAYGYSVVYSHANPADAYNSMLSSSLAFGLKYDFAILCTDDVVFSVGSLKKLLDAMKTANAHIGGPVLSMSARDVGVQSVHNYIGGAHPSVWNVNEIASKLTFIPLCKAPRVSPVCVAYTVDYLERTRINEEVYLNNRIFSPVEELQQRLATTKVVVPESYVYVVEG